jgi:chitin disaccharide deacetylase
MRHFRIPIFICWFFHLVILVTAQEKNLAEKLGHPKDAKLLIIHADDIGVAHSVNAASIAAFEKKGITSGSIMVPCPWFPEIATYANQHPELDLGIHITLTAEWKNYKWGGVLSSKDIPSLLNRHGYFYDSVEEFVKNAKLPEVEKEVKAQIDRAIAFGIKPSHLDSHMGSLFASPELFKLFQKIGREYNMPVLIPVNTIKLMAPHLVSLIEPGQPTINQFFSMYQLIPSEKWKEPYNKFIEQITPGLNEIIVHLAYDNDEMKAVTIDHPDFGSAWREMDYKYVVSEELRSVLQRNNIKLVTWKEVQKTIRPN